MSNPHEGGPPPGFFDPEERAKWFSLLEFPFREVPRDIEKGIGPWFHRFTGKSAEQVRGVLQQDWQPLKPAGLRRLANNLLRYHPCGVLHSKHSAGNQSAWLVLLRLRGDGREGDLISRGMDPGGARYLAPPYQGPLPVQSDRR